MLFWKTATWKNSIPLQLAEETSAYDFSPDGKLLGVASTSKVHAYTMDTLALVREIPLSTPATPKDFKRTWIVAFDNKNLLNGYNALWNSTHTKATVELAQWNLTTGETLQMASHETASPDALSTLWGGNILLTVPAPGPVALDRYNAFRFVDNDRLLVNSDHSACWLKLASAETSCFDDPQFRVFSWQDEAYREIPLRQTTNLQDWHGKDIYKLAVPYPYLRIDRTGKYYVIDAKGSTTDVYFVAKGFPIESLPGAFLGYAENESVVVLSTIQKQGQGMISMVDKKNLSVTYQKKADFLLKPLSVDQDGRVYFLRQDVGQPGFILQMIHNSSYQIIDMSRLRLPAEPEAMDISLKGTFAIGMRDGSVAIASPDGLQFTSFQAAFTPIHNVALTPDGRYLAVASDDGIRVFAVLP